MPNDWASLDYQVTPVNALMHAEVAINAINQVLLARLLKEQQEESQPICTKGYVRGAHLFLYQGFITVPTSAILHVWPYDTVA